MKSWPFDLALVAAVGCHLALAPYTKVEELFTIQAVHDILNHGVFPALAIENFDHMSFPGVVPRTFVGSVAIAGLVKIIALLYAFAFNSPFVADGSDAQLHVQVTARAVLGLANIWGFLRLRHSFVSVLRGSQHRNAGAVFFTLMLVSQFHLVFYASRTLPNFVALPLVNLGISKIVQGDLSGLTWLAFLGVVFRLEVGVFAAIIALVSSLGFGQSNVLQGVFMLAVGSVVGLVLSYSVDSYFWGTPTLPEIQAFFFNVVQGKSAEWGVEPYSAYFKKYIVNFFRPPHVLVLSVLGLLRDPAFVPAKTASRGVNVGSLPARNSLRILAVSAFLFVLVMSFQPHKEWRFIIYVAPVLTLLAGNGFSHLWYNASKLVAHRLLVILMIGSTILALPIASFMAYASSFNYPGGAAINYVNHLVRETPADTNITVHMDVPACMTGITRFTELHRANIMYDKTETDHALAKIWNSVDYLITNRDMKDPQASDLIVYDANHWECLHLVPVFAAVNVQGAAHTAQLLLNDGKFRAHVATSVLADLKRGKFTTLASLFKSSVLLKNYLYIYKRTAPDVMPAILEVDTKAEELEQEELVMKGYGEQLANQVNAQELRESVNEQIDALEDTANVGHVADEL